MSDTIAVPLDFLKQANMSGDTGQPLCPSCIGGYLHPYRVTMSLEGLRPEGNARPYGGFYGVDYLEGWVAVCVGNKQVLRARRESAEKYGENPPDDPELPACGFSMPMTPRTR